MKAEVNLVELAEEAKEVLLAMPKVGEHIMMTDPTIVNMTMGGITADFPLAVSMLNHSTVATVQMLLMWYWEMGRLYGRGEVIRETMGE